MNWPWTVLNGGMPLERMYCTKQTQPGYTWKTQKALKVVLPFQHSLQTLPALCMAKNACLELAYIVTQEFIQHTLIGLKPSSSFRMDIKREREGVLLTARGDVWDILQMWKFVTIILAFRLYLAASILLSSRTPKCCNRKTFALLPVDCEFKSQVWTGFYLVSVVKSLPKIIIKMITTTFLSWTHSHGLQWHHWDSNLRSPEERVKLFCCTTREH